MLLEAVPSILTHNQWKVKLSNDLQKSLLEKDQDLLPFLRSRLQVPNLYLEMEISAVYVDPKDSLPYTDEEKLEAMTKRNPVLKDLQKDFKTRIIYR